jgi:hypothetical protein
MQNSNSSSSSDGQGKRLLIIAGSIVAAVAASVILWASQLNVTPNVHIPTPTMPVTNAYDYMVRAGNNIVDKNKIGYAMSPAHTPASASPDDHPYSLADKQALITANASALAEVREGFHYPFQTPPVRSFATLFPDAGTSRDLARLLVLDGHVKSETGDWGGAAQSDLDALELGEIYPRGGPLISLLVGIACQAIGRKDLWDCVDHLDSRQARAAIARMRAIETKHVPFDAVWQEEEWLGQAGVLEILRSPQWRLGLAQNGSSSPNPAVSTKLLFTSKRAIMSAYTADMDAIVANARQPYAAATAPPIPTDYVGKVLIPAYGQVRLKMYTNQAQNRMLMTALALRAYKLDHGAYPKALADLVPAYLPAVPNDPFAIDQSLRYLPSGTSYLLYSLGPDCKDDGGTPATNPRAHGTSKAKYYIVEVDSKGDLVARINK